MTTNRRRESRASPRSSAGAGPRPWTTEVTPAATKLCNARVYRSIIHGLFALSRILRWPRRPGKWASPPPAWTLVMRAGDDLLVSCLRACGMACGVSRDGTVGAAGCRGLRGGPRSRGVARHTGNRNVRTSDDLWLNCRVRASRDRRTGRHIASNLRLTRERETLARGKVILLRSDGAGAAPLTLCRTDRHPGLPVSRRRVAAGLGRNTTRPGRAARRRS